MLRSFNLVLFLYTILSYISYLVPIKWLQAQVSQVIRTKRVQFGSSIVAWWRDWVIHPTKLFLVLSGPCTVSILGEDHDDIYQVRNDISDTFPTSLQYIQVIIADVFEVECSEKTNCEKKTKHTRGII